jgi:hypothetical protein
MSTWLVILLFSVGAALLFVVGLSLTLIIKGHHIDSEIATNRHMRARGITCAAADARKESCKPSTSQHGALPCEEDNCSTCSQAL